MPPLHSAGFVVRAAYEGLALAVTAYAHGRVANNDGTAFIHVKVIKAKVTVLLVVFAIWLTLHMQNQKNETPLLVVLQAEEFCILPCCPLV